MRFIRQFFSPYAILALLLLLFLVTHTPNIYSDDAPSYIQFNSARPFIYPLFIWLFRWAGSLQFVFIMWIEAFFLFCTLLYARSWLKKHLNIPEFLIFLVLLLMLITIVFHHEATQIGPKGLAFPLFIFTFFYAAECAQKFNFKKFLCLSIMINILILLRLQFYYFYIISALIYLWHFWRKETSQKTLLLNLALVIILSTCFIGIDRIYHYEISGHFAEPAIGDVIAVKEFYLANDAHAARYFKNPQERKYVQTITQEIMQKKLNQDARLLTTLTPSYYQFANQSYNRNSFEIFHIIYKTLSQLSATQKHEILAHISFILASHNIKINILFSLWNFIEDIGGIPIFLFLSIMLITALYRILKERNRPPSILEVLITLGILIIFANASEISLIQDYEERYFIYTEFIFYCIAAAVSREIFFLLGLNSCNGSASSHK